MITSYLNNKNILITGSTGFVGKVLMEKVLRTFAGVSKIYIGLRSANDNAAYDRYKKEIKDSMIFDALKKELGMKAWRKILKKKVRIVPMDLQKNDLGLKPKDLQELRDNLNIIVNCAGTVEFDTRLDISVDVNVNGTLQLMSLAESCTNFEAFCHVSSLFAHSDRLGFIDEKVFEPIRDWANEYKMIQELSPAEIVQNQDAIIGKFPNNYCFSKRMSEEMLFLRKAEQHAKGKVIPLVVIRPSIIACSFAEPVPGWTDSVGLLGGFYTIAGHGILRDLPLNSKLIGD